MAGGLLWQSLQSRVVPYVVAVDRLGEARAVTEAETGYKPTDPQIAWALSRFIENVRGASLDPVLMRKAWLQAYDFTTRRGAAFLSDYARSSGALSQIGERTVSVQVTSVVRASPASFQVKWIESQYERGNPAGSSHWTAILTLVEKPPRDAETLRKNPLGLYVDAIDWSRELEPAAPGKPTSTVTSDTPPTAQIPSNAVLPTEESIP